MKSFLISLFLLSLSLQSFAQSGRGVMMGGLCAGFNSNRTVQNVASAPAQYDYSTRSWDAGLWLQRGVTEGLKLGVMYMYGEVTSSYEEAFNQQRQEGRMRRHSLYQTGTYYIRTAPKFNVTLGWMAGGLSMKGETMFVFSGAQKPAYNYATGWEMSMKGLVGFSWTVGAKCVIQGSVSFLNAFKRETKTVNDNNQNEWTVSESGVKMGFGDSAVFFLSVGFMLFQP